MKKAFTIVELMMVVAIIGMLLGIVTTAAASSIREARQRKADACVKIVEQGIATYYAQKGRWPGPVGDRLEANGTISSRSNDEGVNGQSDANKYVLSDSEVRETVLALIQEWKQNNNPLMDFSGLYVARSAGSNVRGMDFMDAIRGTKQSKRKMKLAEMHFGYPNAHGYFRSFKIVYSIPTDEMKVLKQ